MRIGVDLGGTKIEALALDPTGRELARKRVPTPQGDYAGTVAAVAALVRQIEAEAGAEASVGVGMPGAFSTVTGLVKNSNSTCLIGKPLKEDLCAALGREVRMENDANCFTLSEATDGAGKGAGIVFGVILGTGVGGGIVANGRVLVGPNAITGEWGHNPISRPQGDDLPLRPCYCGRTGCVEMYLSGPALQADGGAQDEAAMARYEDRLARCLSVVINILDPDVIVLGGGVSNQDRLYENVPRLWKPHVFSDHVATKLAKNVHGDSSGVRGAAWLWNGKA